MPLYEAPLGEEEIELPEVFDARSHWKNCEDVISRIGEQAYCGGCWAFAAAFAIADRICIATNGKAKPWVSVQDLMECTGAKETLNVTEKEIIGQACAGGLAQAAWHHYATKGVVTGNDNGAPIGCKPYMFACAIRGNVEYCPYVDDLKLNCVERCQNAPYTGSQPTGKTYKKDQYFGQNSRQLPANSSVDTIKKLIYKDGPLTTSIDGKGLKHKENQNSEGIFVTKGGKRSHAVRIIGWGKSEKAGGFWIIANSWGKNWNGEEKGMARVAFGALRIAENIEFGFPKLKE